MVISRAHLAALCRKYGEVLAIPGIDGAQLLWAIAGNESSFGMDANPRHEPSYCRGGREFSPTLTRLWGCLAHCSYGPWQVMFAHATPGISPLQLAIDPEGCARLTVAFIMSAAKASALSLEQLGQFYNGGHLGANVPDYVSKLAKNYEEPIPAWA